MKNNLLLKILKKDFLSQKAVNIITFIFIAFSTFLISIAIILLVNLFTSMNSFMVKSKTPHFIQMHSGDLDESEIEKFYKDNNEIEEYQVLDFLNIEGSMISNGEDNLSQSIQDNGFSVQSDKFDYLLDLEGNIIKSNIGEIYVPLTYYKNGFFKKGGDLYIKNHKFRVAGFLRDSQMNSELSSSKRFLVNKEDYKKIESLGNTEYIIEFLLKDMDNINAVENKYANSGLPSNGPAITYPLFRVVNAITDGSTIGILIFASLLTIAIALICIRFTLIAKMEEEYKEISVLKALGLRYRQIKKMYILKYFLLAFIGSLSGYILSLLLKEPLLENIYLYLGRVHTYKGEITAVLGVLFISLVILLFVNRVLNRFKKLSVVDALRNESIDDYGKRINRRKLSNNSRFPFDIFMSIKDILARKKLFLNLFVIFIFATVIVTIPQKIHSTLSSENFIEYLGVGKSDIRIDIQQIDDIKNSSLNVFDALSKDSRVQSLNMITTKSFKVKSEDENQDLKITIGDHSKYPIKYSEGRMPENENEIALSQLSSEVLDAKINDKLGVETSEGVKELKIIGIYQDVTNGGKTAKAVFEDDNAPIMSVQINFDINDNAKNIVNEYKDRFSYAKISNTKEYLSQTFGSSVDSIKNASIISKIISVLIVFLVVSLFVRMLIAKDNREISIMAALGVKKEKIQKQYLYRVLIIFFISVILGLLLSNVLGSYMIVLFLSSLGVTSFKFLDNYIITYLLNPLLLLAVTVLSAFISSKEVNTLNIVERIKE